MASPPSGGSSGSPTEEAESPFHTSSVADDPPEPEIPFSDACRTLLTWTFSGITYDSAPPGWPTRLLLGALVQLTDLTSDRGTGEETTSLVALLPGPAAQQVDAALRLVAGRRTASPVPLDVTWDQQTVPVDVALLQDLHSTVVRPHHLVALALVDQSLAEEVLTALGVSRRALRGALRQQIAEEWPEEPAGVWDALLGPVPEDLPAMDPAAVAMMSWAVAVHRPDAEGTGTALDVVLGALGWAGSSLQGADPVPDPAAQTLFWSLRSDAEDLSRLVGEALAAVGVSVSAPAPTRIQDLAPFAGFLNQAAQIVRRTTGSAPIQQRHLIAAALTSAQVPAGLVEVLGVDSGELRMRLCAAAVDAWHEPQQVWTDVLLLDRLETRFASDFVPVRRRRLTGPKPPELADQLQVDVYVTMLAATIVRRSTAMPLSIGLFGEWGSGKSYFMELLRQKVETLSKGSPTEGGAYHSDVIQITFNAWNYADTNLWASLAAEFFDQLGTPETDEDDDRRAAIRASLDAQNQVRQELRQEQRSAADRTKRAREAYAQAVAQREQDSRTLNRELLKAVFSDARVKADVTKVGAQLGYAADESAKTLKFAEDVNGIVDDLTATRRVLATRSLLVPFALLVLLMALTAVVALLVPSDWAARVFGSGALATATAFLGALGWIVRKSRGLVGQLRSVADRADEVRTRLLTSGDVGELAQALHEAEADEAVAQARLVDLDATVTQLNRQLDELAPGRRLYQFIAERAASVDYRSQLGVVSSVRRDFEQLVELMRRWRESADSVAGSASSKQLKPIDRIVLYVDDLDRCEPDQVVEVLQAVHLLLAMDLFVVVVGVDPRWLLRALRSRYQGILGSAAVEQGDLRFGFAESTPQNYLEKIFQIPFVLPGMTPQGFGRLMGSLAAPGDVPADRTPERPTGSSAQPPATARRLAATAATGTSAAGSDREAPLQVAANSEVRRAQAAADPGTSETVAGIVSTPVTRRELDLLGQLAPMVRTPRAATRLFNVYGILRSATDLTPGREFLGGPNQPGDYQAVAQLLGVLAAEPQLLGPMLWGRVPEGQVNSLGLRRLPESARWSSFVDALAPRWDEVAGTWSNGVAVTVPLEELESWQRVVSQLTLLRPHVGLDDIVPYQAWAPQIARFSFLLSPFAVGG